MSSKGYAPQDIANVFGLAKIFLRKLFKINRFKGNQNWLDSMSTYKGALYYLKNYCSASSESKYNEIVNKYLSKDEYSRSLCFLSLTQTELKRLLNQ